MLLRNRTCESGHNFSAAVMNRKRISTSRAPAAIGPYSQAILAGKTLYCSGQIGIDPDDGEIVEGGVEAQTERVLENLGAVLDAAAMDYDDVVRCSVYLADIEDYAAMNEVYDRYFGESPPAREAIEVAKLPRDARVEISCTAVGTG